MKKDYKRSLLPWYGTNYIQKLLKLFNLSSSRFSINPLIRNESTKASMLSKKRYKKTPHFLVFSLSILLSFSSYGQLGTIQIGSGTTTTSGSTAIPVTNYDYAYSQQIVSAFEYAAGGGAIGNITKIRYYFTTVGTPSNYDNWTVYLANTTKTSFDSATDWLPLAQLTEVFSGTIVPVAGGWTEITFTAPFNYTGGNLIVAVDENSLGWLGSPTILSYPSSTNSGIMFRDDGNNPDPSTPPSAYERKSLLAQLQFEGTLASCPPPANLTLAALTATTASLEWTEVGTSTDWDIEYGLTGFTPTGTPTASVTDNPTLISGLAASTAYQYYVRSNCSASDMSAWVGPYGFTTPCVAADIPFFEGFETGYTSSAAVAGCWSQQQVSGTSKWTANTLTSNSRTPRTGTFNATLQYSNEAWMFQGMNLTAGTNYLVKFYAKQDGTSQTDATISASFGMTPNAAAMTSVVIPSSGLTSGNYQEFVGYFNPTVSGVYFLGFLGTKSFADWYLMIDDISVEIAPSCAAPTQVTANAVTATTADFTWSENGTASDWEIEYGIAGFTPTGTPTAAVTSNPTIVSGLNPFTTYSYYVRSICSPTDYSSWSGPYTFATTCLAADIPFFEGFETGYVHDEVVEGCWIQEQPSSTNQWTANNTFTTYNRTPRTGTWDATLRWGGNSWMYRGMNLTAGTLYLVKFYARQDNANAAYANIEAFFGTSSNAASMTDVVISNTSLVNGEYQEFVGYYTPTASGLYYIGIHGSITSSPYYITLDDISVEVAPTCAAPTVISATNITSSSLELSWTENGTATDWEIQYGLGNFVPNTGPSIETNTNPHVVTGLVPASTYRFYVRTICSSTDSSTWSGPYTVSTECAPITTLPWTENFDNMTTLGTAFFPLCWLNENPSPAVWSTTSAPLSGLTAGPLSGPNYLRIRYSSDATMWTPEFALEAGETYELTFNWAGDGNNSWDGAVYVNGSQSSTGATMLGTAFVENGNPTTFNYQQETYCFSPTTSGAYSFGIHVKETDFNWYMSFDDFKLKKVVAVPGVDGSLSVCQTGLPVDLNDVITTTVTDGSWNFNLNPNAVDAAGMLNAASIPAGAHDFLYIIGGCIPDTTTATITVVEASSAGNDGSLAVCRNQPFNLLPGLGGSVDMGGVWTDPNATVVPNGNATSGNIPGQYNYKYIVSNGVCPDDTAKVVVNVQGCDYLGLEDLAFEGFNMYPNPTSDVLFITNTGSVEVFNYEVLDMNGRVILKANEAINGSTTTELDLRSLEVGVYLVRVFNESADKTFRVVKN